MLSGAGAEGFVRRSRSRGSLGRLRACLAAAGDAPGAPGSAPAPLLTSRLATGGNLSCSASWKDGLRPGSSAACGSCRRLWLFSCDPGKWEEPVVCELEGEMSQLQRSRGVALRL